MPNHIHLLLTMRKKFALSATIASYKSYTARNANCLLARSGQFWFPEYYDRYIRNAQHFENVVHYIHQNPVKAGLCVDPGNWLFSSIGARRSDASLK